MIVVKFGGTSLAGTERMRAAARIVAAQRRGQNVVCVVSAMAGITDALLRTITQIATGETTWQRTLTGIREQHQQTLTALTTTITTTGSIPTPTITSRFEMAWVALEADLASLVADNFSSEAARAHTRAAFSGWGERLSVLLFAAALAAEGVDASALLEEPVVMVERRAANMAGAHAADADVHWEHLAPSVGATRAHLRMLFAETENAAGVVVLPGYVARMPGGVITTLGRNGSDASAAVIAAALDAEALYLYSDVAGVRRADPQIVAEATLLPRLTYADASEIAALGARVLHPATLRPLAAAGIPLYLRTTFAPNAPGTDIGPVELLWNDAEPAPAQEWIVVAHPLSAANPLFVKMADDVNMLVEVTGLFLRHADLIAREDDLLADAPLAAVLPDSLESQALHQAGDGPVSGALALLADAPRPFGLSLTARRISVAVPAAEAVATQRRLYAALAHATERARMYAHTYTCEAQENEALADWRQSS